jgi:hypothetical protein
MALPARQDEDGLRFAGGAFLAQQRRCMNV